jgi:hypothetical protein
MAAISSMTLKTAAYENPNNVSLEINMHYARFEVLRAVNIKLRDTVRLDRSYILQKPVLSIFRVVKPCSLVGRHQHDGGNYCLHHQGL